MDISVDKGMIKNMEFNGIKVIAKRRCVECDRVFDLLNEDDANEWTYGHDCEAE
jgi:hypothetical protein